MRTPLIVPLPLIPSFSPAQSNDAPGGRKVSASKLRFAFGARSPARGLELGGHGPADCARRAQRCRKARVSGLMLSQNNPDRRCGTRPGASLDPVIAYLRYVLSSRVGHQFVRGNRVPSRPPLTDDESAQAESRAALLSNRYPGSGNPNGR